MMRHIYILSFFAYSGYYIGLGLLFALGLSDLSRFYSLPLRVVLMVITVITIKQNFHKFFEKSKSSSVFFVFLFWAFYFIKVLYTYNMVTENEISRPWFEYIFYGTTYVVLPYIAFVSIDFHKYKDQILNGFITSGFILGLVALYAYGNVLGSKIGRVSNLVYETGQMTLSPLALSYSGSLTIVLCIHKLIQYKLNKKELVYLIITLSLGFIMFLLGSSRGSIIAVFLCLLSLLYFSSAKRKVLLIFLMLLATPIIIWALESSGSGIIERLLNTQKDGGGGRNLIWMNSFDHFVKNMIFGGRVEIDGTYPHNFILETLMSTGLIGAILLFPIVFIGFKKGLTIDPKDSFVFLIFILGITLHSFSGSIIGATLIFLPLGLILSYKKRPITAKPKVTT